MDLTIREVARLLELPEKTVHRMAREGQIPSYRLHDQYLFNRVELQEWATARKRKVSPELFLPEGAPGTLPSVAAALERGGVYHDIRGATREDVLGAVAELPGIPVKVDRKLLRDLLLTREALASTGIGGGIAIPHSRDPIVIHSEPVILLGFLAQPVDFKAIDGIPVRVLFTLLSPSIRTHLQMLSKLAYVLHDEALIRLLETQASSEAILARLRELEDALAEKNA